MDMKALDSKLFVGESKLNSAEELAKRIFDSYANPSNIGIKGKDRVKELGEVFTPDWVVKDMMNLDGIHQMSYCLKSTFLEPSCGTGNFLVEILARKLAVAYILSNDKSLFDINLIIAVSTIYGVDIMLDNVHESKARMLSMCEGVYQEFFNADIRTDNPDLYKSIKYIIDRNIIFGNMLTYEMAGYKQFKRKPKSGNISLDEYNDKIEMKFSEWELNEANNTIFIKRNVWSAESPDILLEDETNSYDPISYLELHKLKDYIE